MNKYGVTVSGPGGVASRSKLSGPKLLCQLKAKVDVSTVTPDLQPFSSLPWASQLPSQQLTSDLGPYKSCAVVSSAGSLRSSGLGKEIGGHAQGLWQRRSYVQTRSIIGEVVLAFKIEFWQNRCEFLR